MCRGKLFAILLFSTHIVFGQDSLALSLSGVSGSVASLDLTLSSPAG